MQLSDEEGRTDSPQPDEGNWFPFNRLRDNRELEFDRIVDPRAALALIFENSQIFDSVVNRPALTQVMQRNVTDLAVIETEVDPHILPAYNADFFEAQDISRAMRMAGREYKRYRAQVASALSEAIRRFTGQSEGNNGRTPLGRNIDRLRKECGWTFDVLAEKTNLDRRLVLGHVNEGKGAVPRTLKRYATAFSEGLNRTVTVAEFAKLSSPPHYHQTAIVAALTFTSNSDMLTSRR